MGEYGIRVREKHGGQVTEVSLCSPPGNIFTRHVMLELAEAVEVAESNANQKLVVIRADGRHFSFGASVEEHAPDAVRDMLPRFHDLIRLILASDVPVLAAVQGKCLGGGFEVALACTFLIADENAELGVPEIKLAVFPPPAAILLPIKVGDTCAQRLVLTGETCRPAEVPMLVTETAPAGDLERVVQRFIDNHILPRSASSLRLATRASRRTVVEHFARHIDALEGLYLRDLMSTRDAAEGINAFIEKRDPRFVNA